MKKLLCVLFTLIITVSAVLPVFAAATEYTYECGDSITAVLNTTDRTLTLTGTGEMYDYTSTERAPWYSRKSSPLTVIVGEGITHVGSYAFADFLTLTSVQLPATVKTVGDHAFYHCIKLLSLDFPESVETIGGYTLSECYALKSVTLPSALHEIPDGLFRMSTYLETVKMPTDCERIGLQAFLSCAYIKELTLPSNLKEIGEEAFRGCNGISSMSLPEGLETIGNSAFYSLSTLKTLYIPKSVTHIGDNAFCATPWYKALPDGINIINGIAITYKGSASVKTITIPEGTKTISPKVCGQAINVEEIIIPDSVEKICDKAFYNLESLYSVTVPASANDIGKYAFGYSISSQGEPCAMYPFTVYSTAGSAAQQYAVDNSFDFECLHERGAFAYHPVCTVGGIAQSACIYCGEVLSEVKVLPRAHSFGESVTEEATCTQDGQTVRVCELCSYTEVLDTVAATGHTADGSGLQIKESTCTEKGMIYKKCADCGELYDCLEMELVPHSPADEKKIITEATCTTEGKWAILCTVCGCETESGSIEKTGHLEGDFTVLSESDYMNGVSGIRIKECVYCSVVLEYQLFIRGDMNGDGKLNSRDNLNLKKAFQNLLDEDAMFIADVNGDGKLNARDSVAFKRLLIGI